MERNDFFVDDQLLLLFGKESGKERQNHVYKEANIDNRIDDLPRQVLLGVQKGNLWRQDERNVDQDNADPDVPVLLHRIVRVNDTLGLRFLGFFLSISFFVAVQGNVINLLLHCPFEDFAKCP